MDLKSDALSGDFQYETQEEMLLISPQKKKLSIGIPKEDFKNERRISFTPNTVQFLTNNGIKVYIEAGAGLSSGYSDLEFSESGGTILDQQVAVFKSDVIVKISPPTIQQISYLEKNQILISSLNLKTLDRTYFELLAGKRITAIALEYINDEFGTLPFVHFMSEIAGRVAVNIASNFLMQKHGTLLGGTGGTKPSEIVIIGAGDVARSTVKFALETGALVKVYDQSISRLKALEEHIPGNVYCSILNDSTLMADLSNADVVIAALSNQDVGAQYVVSEELITNLKKNSIVIDLSIDQGACFETSKVTSFEKPTFVKHGITHYGIPNIPSTVPRTASDVLGNIYLQLFSNFQNYFNINHFLKNDSNFRNGLYFYNGVLVNKHIGELYDLPNQDLDLIIAVF